MVINRTINSENDLIDIYKEISKIKIELTQINEKYAEIINSYVPKLS